MNQVTQQNLRKFLVILIIGGLWLVLFTPSIVLAQDPQNPRPTVAPPTPRPGDTPAPPTATPTAEPEESSGDDNGSVAVSETDNCASVYGTAVNWGFGNQQDVGVRLFNGGWDIKQMTSSDGTYNFGALGKGVGILSVESSNLKPMINNAAIRLTCKFHTHANIGLYSSESRPQPPGQIVANANTQYILPGQTLDLAFTVKNTLPNPMSQVVITDLFPEGLTIENVNTTVGTVEVLQGRMLTVYADLLPVGAEESIHVTIRANESLSIGTELENYTTLFYSESAADQAKITLTVANPPASIEPIPVAIETVDEVGAENEAEAAAQTTEIEGTEDQADQTDQISVAGSADVTAGVTEAGTEASAETDTETAPPPDVLPVTGVGVSITFLGLLMTVFGLLFKGFKSIHRD